ncbi:MAG: carboxypeptidase-like regulatory domain-containing protein [Bacillota bacterium]|nr:carboxypeptidase-like regulatory domain-containing protein [Bacillota bacterium]
MKKRTTGFIFLIVMLVSLALVGCFGGGTKSYILTGTVTEFDTEVPLAGATVEIGTKKSITNAFGLYELKGVPGGSGTLHVTLDGYEPHEQDVTVSADATIDVDLETQAEDLNLGGVSVEYYGSYVEVDGVDPLPVMKRASLILNGKEQPLLVDSTDNEFWAYKALRPGLNTIQFRVWDEGDHARTTPIQELTWDIPRLDLLIIMDSDTPEVELDLHMIKRLVNKFVYDTDEEGDRHVYWGNGTPTDFGDGDHQNPTLDVDGGGRLEAQEIICLKELTPGDYHIWVHAYDLEDNDLTEARVQVILDAANDNPTEKVYTEKFTLDMEETGVYIITLRVSESGERSFVYVEPDTL